MTDPTDDPNPDDAAADEVIDAAADKSAVPPVDDDDDFWDDDDWADRPRRQGGGVPPAWIIAGVVVVLIVIGIVVVSNGKDDDQTQAGGGGGGQTTAAEGGDQCATWPPVGGLGKPTVASKPGIHMWSDLDGWHLSRVPGPGVPSLVATVSATDASGNSQDVEPKGTATGGASATAADQRLTVILPAGETPSQADFEPGVYSSTVIIQMSDDTGALLPTTAFTSGGGDKPPTNPITATQVMVPCGE